MKCFYYPPLICLCEEIKRKPTHHFKVLRISLACTVLLPSRGGQNWTDGIYSITDLWQLKRICWQKLIRDDLILPAADWLARPHQTFWRQLTVSKSLLTWPLCGGMRRDPRILLHQIRSAQCSDAVLGRPLTQSQWAKLNATFQQQKAGVVSLAASPDLSKQMHTWTCVLPSSPDVFGKPAAVLNARHRVFNTHWTQFGMRWNLCVCVFDINDQSWLKGCLQIWSLSILNKKLLDAKKKWICQWNSCGQVLLS